MKKGKNITGLIFIFQDNGADTLNITQKQHDEKLQPETIVNQTIKVSPITLEKAKQPMALT